MPTSAPETVSAKPRGKAGRPRKEHKQPYLRGEIVRVYATTGSLTETSKALGIDRGTVADIFARNPDDFSTAQKLHAKNLYSDADTCRDLSMQPERLAECSSPQLAVMSGIYTQRAGEILSGPIGKLSAPAPSGSADNGSTPTLAGAMALLVNSGQAKVTLTRTTEKVELSATESAKPVKADVGTVEPPKPPEGEQNH